MKKLGKKFKSNEDSIEAYYSTVGCNGYYCTTNCQYSFDGIPKCNSFMIAYNSLMR